jgi:propionate CoA-transferase
VRLLSAVEAVQQVPDGATLMVGGSGAGHSLPQLFIDTLADVFESDAKPRDLTTVRVVGIGDFADRGFSQLALPGLMKRTIGSNIGNEPRLGELVERGEVEAYSFPQGVLSQLCREIAAGRPGKQGSATEDLVEVVDLAGEEWLFFKAFPIDVAVIRGSTIDEDGNLTMEDEAVKGEMLAMAMAAHNSGGIVIAQAKRLAAAKSMPARSVVVPGALIDFAYLDPNQTQTYATSHSPYYSGALRRPATDAGDPPKLDVRKVIARRSLLEFRPGDVCNLGFGISQMIGAIAWEEGIEDELVLTVEQGIFGGVPVAGNEGGAGFNFQAMIDQPYMFDFYDGGGLDIASLSFAQVDSKGNVNVHKFPGRLRGPGGFPNISSRTGRMCFVGTLTASGLEVAVEEGRLSIAAEGTLNKFVDTVDEVSFSGSMAEKRGQTVRYITERAVFELRHGRVTLIEIADGLDPQTDVIDHMGFVPEVADDLRTIDARVFAAGPMGLADDFEGQR